MKSILLIEDTAVILEDFIEYLELEGYTVFSAINGRDGLGIARKVIPDLIVCDVLMPGMNGYEVLRLLKEDVKTCQIPFIVSTSKSEVIDKTTALKMGVDDYLVKPFTLETLLSIVKARMLDGSRRVPGGHVL